MASANRIVKCPQCNKELEVRSNFAYLTLTRHLLTHKEK